MSSPSGEPSLRPPRWSFSFTTTFTTVVKLVGLAIAVDETLVEGTRDPTTLLIAAFMMAGAQGVESFVRGLGR